MVGAREKSWDLASYGIDVEGMKACLAAEPMVVVAYLFGSVAMGRADHMSDVTSPCCSMRCSISIVPLRWSCV